MEHIEVPQPVHATRSDSLGVPSGTAKLSAEEPDALMHARPGPWEPWRVTARATQPQLFSLREHAIAKELGSGYVKPRRCVSRLGLTNGGLDSLESSPYVTLSRGAFSASSLVTPIRADTSRDRLVPACNTDLSLPTPPHTTSGQERMSSCPLASSLLERLPLSLDGVLP